MSQSSQGQGSGPLSMSRGKGVINRGRTSPEDEAEGEAAPAVTEETAPEPVPPPTPPAKPGIFERLGFIRAKKVEGNRGIYLAFLRRIAVGEDLNDKDLASFDSAMRGAGISPEQFEIDRQILARQLVEGVKTRASLERLQKEHAAASAAWQKYHAMAGPIAEKDAALLKRAQDLGDEVTSFNGRIESLARHAADHRELLAE